MANNDGVIDNNPINNLPKEPEQSKLSDAQVAMNSAVETAELAQRGLLQAEAARMAALQEVQRLAAVNDVHLPPSVSVVSGKGGVGGNGRGGGVSGGGSSGGGGGGSGVGNAGGSVGDREENFQAIVVEGDLINTLTKQKRKLAELIAESRASKKIAELAEMKKPQGKRALDLLLDLQHMLNDVQEVWHEVHIENDLSNIDSISENLIKLQERVADEVLKNKIANKSVHGWATVGKLEDDPLYFGPDAEEKTKKLRYAENQAGRALRNYRARRMGRGAVRGGRRAGYGNGGGNYSNNFGGGASSGAGPSAGRGGWGPGGGGGGASGGGSSFNGAGAPGMMCYKCKKNGHIQKFCPE